MKIHFSHAVSGSPSYSLYQSLTFTRSLSLSLSCTRAHTKHTHTHTLKRPLCNSEHYNNNNFSLILYILRSVGGFWNSALSRCACAERPSSWRLAGRTDNWTKGLCHTRTANAFATSVFSCNIFHTWYTCNGRLKASLSIQLENYRAGITKVSSSKTRNKHHALVRKSNITTCEMEFCHY